MIIDVAEVILNDVLGNLANDIIELQTREGIRDTGASAGSLHWNVATTDRTLNGQLFGFKRFWYQQHGRGPNKSRKPSKELVKQIRAWTARKGIPEEAAYPIALKIARVGTPVPNPYNPGDVLSRPLDVQRVKEIVRPRLREAVFKEFKSMFLNK